MAGEQLAGGPMGINPLIGAQNPDLVLQALRLQRQQAYAMALRQMAYDNSQPVNETAGGWVLPKSGWEGAAKILGAVASKDMLDKADLQQAQLLQNQYGAYSNLFGGGGAQGALPPAPQDQTGAITQTPPSPKGAQYAQALNGGAPAPGGATPAPGQMVQAGGLYPSGMPSLYGNPQADMYAYMLNPQGYSDQALKNAALTDMQKNAAAAHMPMSRLMEKEAHIPLESVRAGSLSIDPMTGQERFVPKLPDNAMPLYDQQGNIAGAAPLPGAAGVVQQNAAAQALGSAAGQTETVFNPQTNAPTIIPKTQVLGGAGGGFPGYQGAGAPAGGQGFQAGPSLGQQTSAEGLSKGGIDRFNQLQNSANYAPQRIPMFDQVIDLAAKANTGPQSEKEQLVRGVLHAVGINADDPKIDAYQEFQKYAANIAAQNFKALGGTGTDSQLDLILHGNPNTEQMPGVVKSVATYLKGQDMALMAQAQGASNWKAQNGGDMGKFDQYENAWRNAYDPKVFNVLAMPPNEQQAYIQGMTADARKSFTDNLKKLVDGGWIR